MKKFERDNSLALILVLRHLSLEKLAEYSENLLSKDSEERQEAVFFFSKHSPQFSLQELEKSNKTGRFIEANMQKSTTYNKHIKGFKR